MRKPGEVTREPGERISLAGGGQAVLLYFIEFAYNEQREVWRAKKPDGSEISVSLIFKN